VRGSSSAGTFHTTSRAPPYPDPAPHCWQFGHGEFNIVNATHAHFTWRRNVDAPKVTDEVWVINTPV